MKTVARSELCQVSLTGIRGIVLLGLLMDAPRSLDEIREAFIKYNIMEVENSDDILRIDLNTLRAMGCEISRSCMKTGYKYVLIKHPFDLKVTPEEISAISKGYGKLLSRVNFETLLKYHYLFIKIAKHITEIGAKEQLLGISVLKSCDTKRIEELLEDCKYNRILKISYKSPVAKEAKEKEFIAQKLVCKNEKIYIYGYDPNINEGVTYNINRIEAFISKKDNDDCHKFNPVTIKFILTDFGVNGLEENESISEYKDHKYIISGEYHNNFVAMQRMLSFGSSCTVLEPIAFRENIIKTLKSMRDVYND